MDEDGTVTVPQADDGMRTEWMGSGVAYENNRTYTLLVKAIFPKLHVLVQDTGGSILADWTVTTDDTFTGNGLALYSSSNEGSLYKMSAYTQSNPSTSRVNIDVVIEGTGQGDISSTVNGETGSISTDSTTASVEMNSDGTVSATPMPGSGFGGWYRRSLDGQTEEFLSADSTIPLPSLTEDLILVAVFTGTPPPPFTLDLNGDGIVDAETDGRVGLRYLGGVLPDGLLVTNPVAPLATIDMLRPTGADVKSWLDTSGLTMLDVDGDGQLNPFTDGRLLYRFLNEAIDSDLIKGTVVAPSAQHTTTAAIRQFLARYHPDAETLPPLLTASLLHDTGMGATDGLTADPTVQGTVTDAHAIVAFRAGLDGTQPEQFSDVFRFLEPIPAGEVSPVGARAFNFTLDQPRIEEINGDSLIDGPHTLHLQAMDLFGNESAFTLPFTLDATPPLIAGALLNDTGAPGDQLTSDPAIRATVSDVNSIVDLRAGIDDVASADFLDSLADLQGGLITLDAARLAQINGAALSDGAHALHLRADQAGLLAQFDLGFTLDTTAPILTVTAPAENEMLTAQSRLTGQVGDANRPTSLTYQWANSPSSFGVPVAVADGTFDVVLDQEGLAPGPTSMTVTVTDQAGNTTTVTHAVTIPEPQPSSDLSLVTSHVSLDSSLSTSSDVPLTPALSPQGRGNGEGILATVPMGFSTSFSLQSADLNDTSDDRPLTGPSRPWLTDFVVSSAVADDPNRDLAIALS